MSDWIFDINMKAHNEGRGFLDENPERSYRWLTRKAIQLRKMIGIIWTVYMACAYASARKKAQAFMHNMQDCSAVACSCNHYHDPAEWKPVKRDGKTYYPTHEEAEYSAALCWTTGLFIIYHAVAPQEG